MREDRVIALAGLFQAIALVRALARRGGCDAVSMRASLASVLRIDAATPADVYGGIVNLRIGLECLVDQLNAKTARDVAVTRMTVTVLRLERALAARGDVLQALRAGIEETVPMLDQVESGTADVSARLAKVYSDNLSPLRPRVMVEGDPNFLSQPTQVNQIRALLLAAVRSAVLWRQLGGSRLRLLFRQRQYAMMARGLLTRCTLDGA